MSKRTLLVVLLALSLYQISCGPPKEKPVRGVLLVVLDSVRADHVSAYGYSRQTTPNLDRLASEGEIYTEAYAQSPWTLPSMATILTGQPPHVHGAGRKDQDFFPVLQDVETLAELLAEDGFRTAAFVNVVWCDPISGLARGFERYDFATSDATNQGQRRADEVTDAALTWLRGLENESFFMMVHYFDPHLTYDPPAPYDTRFLEDKGLIDPDFGSAEQVFAVRSGELPVGWDERASLIARYDGEIAFTDAQFARLRDELERTNRWDDTLVIVVADHGEEFWDHRGFEHGHTHYRELIQVPLIVKGPGREANVVRYGRVRQLDIAPTILEFAGIEDAPDLPGKVLDNSGVPYAVAEGSLWAGDLVSVRGDEGTLIWSLTYGKHQIFETSDQPELRPLQLEEMGSAQPLQDIIDALPTERRMEQQSWELTEDQLERLRTLGYVE